MIRLLESLLRSIYPLSCSVSFEAVPHKGHAGLELTMCVTEPDLEFVIPLMLGLGVCVCAACAVLGMGGAWALYMLGKCV